jgi:hypothetical protein
MHTFHTCRAELAELKTRRSTSSFALFTLSINAGLFSRIAPITNKKNGRKDTNAAEIVRRKEGLVERL